jgi:hypothetical protein
MRRAIIHSEAEIRWHDEFDAVLAAEEAPGSAAALNSARALEIARPPGEGEDGPGEDPPRSR